MQLPAIQRRKTRAVRVGGSARGGGASGGGASGVVIGGGAPVSVQSMTKTPTRDAEATLAQVRALAEAGADLVRVAVPTKEDTAALRAIVAGSPVPIVADVHFHFERALEAIEAGARKIRLNPGNIRDRAQVRRVIAAAKKAGVAIRVGVNEGSVVERAGGEGVPPSQTSALRGSAGETPAGREGKMPSPRADAAARAAARAADLSRPLDELMEAKLAEYLQVFEEEGFDQLVLSAKSHDAVTCVAAYRRLAARWDYPLHLGVTHAGTAASGAVRSAAALGALLAEGIGDTIRISYAGDPVEEVKAACELLASLRLRPRRGIDLIACPTCGRLQTDILPIVEAIRVALAGVTAPVTVAIMGCIVNGPGEAESADVAICAGKGKAVLYRRGQKVRTLDASEIVQAVVDEVAALAARNPP